MLQNCVDDFERSIDEGVIALVVRAAANVEDSGIAKQPRPK
jgi:hypothetical protein